MIIDKGEESLGPEIVIGPDGKEYEVTSIPGNSWSVFRTKEGWRSELRAPDGTILEREEWPA